MPVNRRVNNKFVTPDFTDSKGRAYHEPANHGDNSVQAIKEILGQIKKQQAQSDKFLKTGSASHSIDISKDLERYAETLAAQYGDLNQLLEKVTKGYGVNSRMKKDNKQIGIHGLSSNIDALEDALKTMKEELESMAKIKDVIDNHMNGNVMEEISSILKNKTGYVTKKNQLKEVASKIKASGEVDKASAKIIKGNYKMNEELPKKSNQKKDYRRC